MKIGILTTHDSTNYGAQLQVYAMQYVLTGLGHDAKVIDLRRNPEGERLKRYVTESRRRRFRRAFSFAGGWIDLFRRHNAERFLKQYLKLTRYHFTCWRNVPQDMDLDLILVGSDQVWNPAINDVANYMPSQYAPKDIPWISYAASLGTPLIPNGTIDIFRTKLPLFSAVSVREHSSVEILANMGIAAEHVVDPVVLAGIDCWKQWSQSRASKTKRLFVYSLNIGKTIDVSGKVSSFAQQNGFHAEIFTGGLEFLPLPSLSKPRGFARNLKHWGRLFSMPEVRVRLCSGPIKFLRSLADSDIVITDSYHALVFASLFGKEIRYIVPISRMQSDMMVRILDFAEPIIKGPVLQSTLDAALESLSHGEHTQIDCIALEQKRAKSFEWLKSAIEQCKC